MLLRVASRIGAMLSLVLVATMLGATPAPAPPAGACTYSINYGCFYTGSGSNTRIRKTVYSLRSQARSTYGTTTVTAGHYNSYQTGSGYASLSYNPDSREVYCDAGYHVYSSILIGCNYINT